MTDGALPQYNIVLAPLASHTVSGVLTVPSGCKATIQVQVGAIQILYDALATNSLSYVLPVATPGAALHLNAICLYGGSEASAEVSIGLAMEDTLAITVPASPTVSLPVTDATAVTSATDALAALSRIRWQRRTNLNRRFSGSIVHYRAVTAGKASYARKAHSFPWRGEELRSQALVENRRFGSERKNFSVPAASQHA